MEVCGHCSLGRVVAIAVAALTLAGSAIGQQNAAGRSPPATLFSGVLAEAPGHNVVVVELNFPPNASAPSTSDRHPLGHRHPGSVYVYVTQGAVRLGIEGEPVQVVQAGQIFFEPVGAHHIVNENTSSTEPARAIAFMIVPEGLPLSTRDRE